MLKPADMLNALRQTFGLDIPQLATSLRTDTVTVYGWLRADTMGVVPPSLRQRLRDLYTVAQAWQELSPLPGKVLLEAIPPDGLRLMDLLCADRPNPAAFLSAHASLGMVASSAERTQRYRRQQRDALKTGVARLRANVHSLGMDLS